MQKHILIVWNITEPVEIQNSASTGQKSVSNLEKDNFLYIDVLDYWTNLIKIFFKVPWVDIDTRWVDLVYESTIDWSKKLIDIKTQANILNWINLYIREFSDVKIANKNYIIFNKVDKKLYWKIYLLTSQFITKIWEDKYFTDFLNKIDFFEELTQKYIEADEKLSKQFKEIKQDYNNAQINIDWVIIKIVYMAPRKDKDWVVWNTNFKENIKLEIQL